MTKRFACLLLAFAAVALGCHSAVAQNYALAPIPKLTYLTNSGAILSGYKLCSYAAGTTTSKATYSNSTGTPNTNPVTLDSYGRANVWINSDAYKFTLFAPGTGNTCNGSQVGTQIWSVDNIRDFGLVAFESGSLTGSGTANTVPKYSSATALTDSSITDDGTWVKIDNQVLVNGTSTDATGALVVAGGLTVSNTSSNAIIGALYATGGAFGSVSLYSTYTGTGSLKPLQLIMGSDVGLKIDTNRDFYLPALACPAGKTGPLTIDENGLISRVCA